MGYKALTTKSGFITTSKKVNKLNSKQSYKRTILGSTKHFKRLKTDSLLSIQVRCYFSLFKEWAIYSHDNIALYYKRQRTVLYKSTFQRYCKGEYTRIDINRLYEYFIYFKNDVIVCNRLIDCECNLLDVSFVDFINLVEIPLPDGYYFTLKEVSKGVYEPVKFKK